MISFQEYILCANLSGMHKKTGKSYLDYYVLDNDINNIEYSIEKNTNLIDNPTDKNIIGKLSTGDLVTIVSKKTYVKGASVFIQIHSKELGIGMVPLTAIRKPTGERTFNRGDVSEGIIAAAIATKFSIVDRDIQIIDVFNTIDKLQGKSQLFMSNGVDSIKLMIKLKPASFAAFISTKYRGDLVDEYSGAVKFANSTTVARYAKYLLKNLTVDNIIVLADGTSDEKGTKVDMNVLVGLDGTTPRKIKNLSLSLKSGDTKTIAQTGTALNRVISFWKNFGIDINSSKYEKTENWFSTLFDEVIIDINKKLGNDSKEKDYIKSLSHGININATGGDNSVVILHIKKGDFSTYSFKNLDAKLKEIDLHAISYTSSKRPEIHIIDTNTNEKLIGFRLEVRDLGKTLKVHVEKGPLLNKLTKFK